MSKEAIILANGAFPTQAHLIKELQESPYLICCDGAIDKLEHINKQPHAIIGDLDSLSAATRKKYQKCIYHYAEQDSNDLTKAVNWCLERGFCSIKILGATGEREDHTIANIFLMLRYMNDIQVCMQTDLGLFTPIKRSQTFFSFKGQQVSIFSPYPDTLISSTNLRYPLKQQGLPELWNGTLNESLGDTFRLDFTGKGLIVYQLDPK